MHTVLMAFVDTLILCLKPWDAFVIISHMRNFVLPSLRENFSEVFEKESNTDYEIYKYNKRTRGL